MVIMRRCVSCIMDVATDHPQIRYLQTETHPLSPEVQTAELLQCGGIISNNVETVANGLDHLMDLVCGSVSDDSEADIICPVLLNARNKLIMTIGHADAAACSIDQALIVFCHCVRDNEGWSQLSAHLKDFMEHSRQFRDLWRQNRNFLNQEFLPSLSGLLYSPQNKLPQTGLWLAQLTRSEHIFPRLQAWGQLPNIVDDICAALDPVSGQLDKVESYVKAVSERLQIIVSTSSCVRNEQVKSILPGLYVTQLAWHSRWSRTRVFLAQIRRTEPSRHLPIDLRLKRAQVCYHY